MSEEELQLPWSKQNFFRIQIAGLLCLSVCLSGPPGPGVRRESLCLHCMHARIQCSACMAIWHALLGRLYHFTSRRPGPAGRPAATVPGNHLLCLEAPLIRSQNELLLSLAAGPSQQRGMVY